MRRRFLAPALPLFLLASCDAGGTVVQGHLAAFPDLHSRLVRTQGTSLEAAALHEHLSAALVGGALTEGFLRAAESSRRRVAEGATVRIEGVEYEALEIISQGPGGSHLQASWLVTGTVRHGDHSHRRSTRYAGRYLIVDTPKGPRIAEERAGDAERLPAPPPRGGRSTSALDLLVGPR